MIADEAHRSTIEHFTGLVQKFGQDPRAHDWGSRESQELRFRVLLGALGARIGAGTRILDVGCGQGDLLAYLQKQHPGVAYEGIDITPAMIEVAQRRFPDANFRCADLLADAPAETPRYDLVLASGIFYMRQSAPLDHMLSMARRFFALSCNAVAFNSLSAYATNQDRGEFYADPADVVRACRAITPWVTLRHDYHPRDFTVHLFRDARAA